MLEDHEFRDLPKHPLWRTILPGFLMLVTTGACIPAIFAGGYPAAALPAALYLGGAVLLYRAIGFEFVLFCGIIGIIVGFWVFGIGGSLAIEVARAVGFAAPHHFADFTWRIGEGALLGGLLGSSVAAFVLGGVSRNALSEWLIGCALLIVPILYFGLSPEMRGEVVRGAPLLNAGFIAAAFILFGRFMAAKFRGAYLRHLYAHSRQTEDAEIKAALARRHSPQPVQENSPVPEIATNLASEESWKGIGIALSGGGHRAALFDLGALFYLTRAGAASYVSHIASVSGGSITNGFIAATMDFRKDSVERFDAVLGAFARQLADHGSMFAIPFTIGYTILLGLLTLSAILIAIAWAIGFAWWPAPLNLSLSVIFLFVAGMMFRERGWLCRLAFERTLFSRPVGKTGADRTRSGKIRKPVTIGDLDVTALHVFCATEIQTGNSAYFFNLPAEDPFAPGARTQPILACSGFKLEINDHDLSTAVGASAALPGAFPVVKLDVIGIQRIARRKGQSDWRGPPAKQMMLLDGGVRDNLGVGWFEHVDQRLLTPHLIVVNGAANRTQRAGRRIRKTLWGEITALLLVKDLPYTIREQNKRRELLGRFHPFYAGIGDDAGVVLHIEESPLDLAEAILTHDPRAEKWELWMTADADRDVAAALLGRADRDTFIARASNITRCMLNDEGVEAWLAEAKQDLPLAGRTQIGFAEIFAHELWLERAEASACQGTHLWRTGRRNSALLIRHAFALAMAKLHILFGYPLVALPSIAEIEALMAQAPSVDALLKPPNSH